MYRRHAHGVYAGLEGSSGAVCVSPEATSRSSLSMDKVFQGSYDFTIK